VTITLPVGTNPRLREAVDELLRAAEGRFTGSLVFDLKDGVPCALKRTEARRLGKPTGLRPLDTVGKPK